MKKLIFLLCFLFATPSFAEFQENYSCPPRGTQTYHPYGRTSRLSSFYSRKKSPKKKNRKNMPSTTRHIG